LRTSVKNLEKNHSLWSGILAQEGFSSVRIGGSKLNMSAGISHQTRFQVKTPTPDPKIMRVIEEAVARAQALAPLTGPLEQASNEFFRSLAHVDLVKEPHGSVVEGTRTGQSAVPVIEEVPELEPLRPVQASLPEGGDASARNMGRIRLPLPTLLRI
jgi:hypothetical protein